MELVNLSKKYGDFYAPAFAVRIGRDDSLRDLQVAISQVEVDLSLGGTSHFSFTLANCYDDKLQVFRTGRGDDLLELLKFGCAIEVRMGYGDAGSMPIAIVGMVTTIETSFPESGPPELSVSGFDHAFPLTLGKSSDSWSNRTDSEVVQRITSFHNLNAVVDNTNERHSQIEQNQQCDWDFLKTLAERNSDERSNHFELYVAPEGPAPTPTLHFGAPRVKSAPVVRLVWGAGLLSFKPQANLAGQVSKVEVYGRDVERNQTIIGRATADDVSGPRSKSIAQHLRNFVRAPDKQPTLRLRQPVFSQAEADKRARSALSEKSRTFLTGEAETIGLPELRPDRTVQIDNLGTAFSKIYDIEQATHRIDTGGYRTRCKVRETNL